jgi:hypothetical protein
MSFTAPPQRIIFSQRVCRKFFGHEDSPQVRLCVESDPEHIKNFALHPICPRPERHGRRDFRIRVVDPAFDDQAFGSVEILDNVMDLETSPGPARVAEVIGRSQLGEKIEATCVFERIEQFEQPGSGDADSQVVSKP